MGDEEQDDALVPRFDLSRRSHEPRL